MAFLEKINDYVSRTRNLMLQQYRDQPKFEGWQEAYDQEIQEIENALCDMIEKRTVNNAEGVLLDEIGAIVGQPRGGFPDEFYRRLINAKIGENTSQGNIEKIIEVTALLTGATQVHMQEMFPAGFSLSVNTELDQDLVNFYYERLSRIAVGGVRLTALICYDEEEPFAFDGDPGPASGFGDVNDVNVGGKMADFKIRTEPCFAFAAQAGVEDGDSGFGSLEDGLVGGSLKGI